MGLVSLCHAGPPFVTDDPEPVDAGAWEVNYALTGTHEHARTSAFLPQVDANYGPAPGIQLHVQPQAAYVSAAGERAYGIGDSELGLKVRLTPASEEQGGWMVSLYPLLEVPSGSVRRGLGSGATSEFLPVWAQTTRGAWTMYGGGGYWVDGGTDRKNAWAAGWVVLYQFTERLQAGGEVFGKTADTVGARASSGFSLGAIYNLAKDYNLLLSAGRGLSNAAATNEASLYIGLQVAY